jgi:hypothetical protein
LTELYDAVYHPLKQLYFQRPPAAGGAVFFVQHVEMVVGGEGRSLEWQVLDSDTIHEIVPASPLTDPPLMVSISCGDDLSDIMRRYRDGGYHRLMWIEARPLNEAGRACACPTELLRALDWRLIGHEDNRTSTFKVSLWVFGSDKSSAYHEVFFPPPATVFLKTPR